ncbi:DNA alkylation repair protein, partial [Delftia tsuruhatensis]
MKAPAPRRKGANRKVDITPELLQALSLGEIETATLTESLAVDQARLLQAVFPDAWPQLEDTAQALGQLGILKRMECIGGLLWQALGQAGWQRCLTHRSDTVRG